MFESYMLISKQPLNDFIIHFIIELEIKSIVNTPKSSKYNRQSTRFIYFRLCDGINN